MYCKCLQYVFSIGSQTDLLSQNKSLIADNQIVTTTTINLIVANQDVVRMIDSEDSVLCEVKILGLVNQAILNIK